MAEVHRRASRPADAPGIVRLSGQADGLVWDVAPPRPYTLRFENKTDVVCLLTGAIDARTAYDGARAAEMRFEALTAAFHPGGGAVDVVADRCAAGFLAFTYPRGFADRCFGDDFVAVPVRASVDNLHSPEIAGLVGYARTLAGSPGLGQPLAMEALAHLAYHEAYKAMKAVRQRIETGRLTRREIDRMIAYIDANLGESLTLSSLAALLGAPVTTMRRRFHQTTGMPIYRFVMERRLNAAQVLLRDTDLPIAAIAAECGFASQQHLTTVLRSRIGVTPAAVRRSARSDPDTRPGI